MGDLGKAFVENPSLIYALAIALVAVTAAFVKGWVVPGKTYRKSEERGDRFEAMCFRLLETNKVAIDAFEQRTRPWSERERDAYLAGQESARNEKS